MLTFHPFGGKRLNTGDIVRLELPYSEVCMSMRVAGTTRFVRLTENRMAQILNDDLSSFSAPVTTGEAGIYSDPAGYYCYPIDAI